MNRNGTAKYVNMKDNAIQRAKYRGGKIWQYITWQATMTEHEEEYEVLFSVCDVQQKCHVFLFDFSPQL